MPVVWHLADDHAICQHYFKQHHVAKAYGTRMRCLRKKILSSKLFEEPTLLSLLLQKPHFATLLGDGAVSEGTSATDIFQAGVRAPAADNGFSPDLICHCIGGLSSSTCGCLSSRKINSFTTAVETYRTELTFSAAQTHGERTPCGATDIPLPKIPRHSTMNCPRCCRREEYIKLFPLFLPPLMS